MDEADELLAKLKKAQTAQAEAPSRAAAERVDDLSQQVMQLMQQPDEVNLRQTALAAVLRRR